MKQPVSAITVAILSLAAVMMLDRYGAVRPSADITRVAATSPSPAPVSPKAPARVVHQDTIDSLLPGKGQEETFYLCAACHGTALIKQQGLSRELWEASFQLMIDRHGMARPDDSDRDLIIGYLAQNFPPRRKGRGGDNPFLK